MIQQKSIAKCPTGIKGFDEITWGGLPQGRTTLVCGGPGCGKTMFGVEFLVHGAVEHGEPGVLVSFEERTDDLIENARSLECDLADLVERGLLVIDHVRIERSEIEETGEYDLEGLFVRLGQAVDRVRAKRILLDTVEALFAGLGNEAVLRAELRRLFLWLKERGLTCVLTGERGEPGLTRYGFEEYVSDCVIALDNRVERQISTRRLRIIKYRGSSHGTNEYPFLIDEHGLSVLPITSVGLDYEVSRERISSGVGGLDEMLGGAGFFRGSSILVSGTAGTGKTTLSALFADGACRRGERAMLFVFEESRDQVRRNMGSIGLDLGPHEDAGLLRIVSTRPTLYGLETHLAEIHREVVAFAPSVVTFDPLNSLTAAGPLGEVDALVLRLVDFLKSRHIAALFTTLTHGGAVLEASQIAVSSLMDTWIVLKDIDNTGERNRALWVLKSRGMEHSNQVREYRMTSSGIDLVDSYFGPEGVLTGSARLGQEARDRDELLRRREDYTRRSRDLERKRRVLEAQIATMRAEIEADAFELDRLGLVESDRVDRVASDREAMTRSRGGKADGHDDGPSSSLREGTP